MYIVHVCISWRSKYCHFMLNINAVHILNQAYRLIITGHSLGAGVAALLSIILQPVYPNLHCYAFSPPGGLIKYNITFTIIINYSTCTVCVGTMHIVYMYIVCLLLHVHVHAVHVHVHCLYMYMYMTCSFFFLLSLYSVFPFSQSSCYSTHLFIHHFSSTGT